MCQKMGDIELQYTGIVFVSVDVLDYCRLPGVRRKGLQSWSRLGLVSVHHVGAESPPEARILEAHEELGRRHPNSGGTLGADGRGNSKVTTTCNLCFALL
jgi:hypothetical protein